MTLFEVCKMYKNLNLGKNPICEKCEAKNKSPLRIWRVGSNFKKDEHKVLFVGKTGRGDWGKAGSDGYVDTSQEANDYFFNISWPYWSYTREIVSRLYGSPKEGWNRIAFTNIVKCTDTITVDKTEDSVKNNCILKLGVIQKEIEILKPKNVIFYTGKKYDYYIDTLINHLKASFNAEEITSSNKTITSRPKRGNDLKYDKRELIDSKGNRIMRFLITSHPERQNKERFVDNLVEWIHDGEHSESNKN